MSDPNERETDHLDVGEIMAHLNGEEIYALSDMFFSWAATEANLNVEQRSRFLHLAREYRVIADQCGLEWTATSNSNVPHLLKFLAGLALENSMGTAAAEDNIEQSYIEVDAFLASLAAKVVGFLRESDDPGQLRAEMLECAESAGYWHYINGIRQQTPELFAQDLLKDNPDAALWAREARKWIVPEAIVEEHALLHALDPLSPGYNSI